MPRFKRFAPMGSVFVLVILAAMIPSPAMADHPQPVRHTVQRLAKELEVLAADVRVVEFEEVTWRDSSLKTAEKVTGCRSLPGGMCE